MGEKIILPPEFRPLLRVPFGTLFTGDGRDTIQKVLECMGNPTKLISVGDVTTFHLLDSGIIPDICIVDDRTKREPASEKVVSGTRHTGFKEITVTNPAGIITEDLINVINYAFESDQNIRIFVYGEEDLAALPSILMAPICSVVLYGQPGEGIVMVKITRPKKIEIQKLIDSIIEQPENKDKLHSNIWRKLNGH
ncbi:Protein of unknown function DUF359 [Methanosalsum zhilinae DSM 4017]|uniref:GTP-dependent dephospho-CoA kinase n=1 Tax=Methanosalsum zhilinae (strain DSM 4017 / NBRC 107636 / OCM 62 / WeN5) TaxID=679901 RepID=F7XPT1_METZD|nr:GTP-dependent dephospho-CoA kinase family protein [Methanosalsum zhilinae]AEH60356.1 Protein of unknown function DUF359 [Methanosalsum zhilinae DSM 4017]